MITQSLPPPINGKALGDEGEISPLDEDPIMDISSLT